MKKISTIKKSIAVLMIAALAVPVFAGCGSNQGGDSKAFDSSFKFAESKVKSYSSGKVRNSAVFSDKAFSTANAAAMLVNEKTTQEEFEQIARYLYLDSITVADGDGTIVACYPEKDKGKKLKKTEDKKLFSRVVKGIAAKLMSTPEHIKDSDEYSVMVGVMRPNDPGAVVIGFKSDDYADITGEKLADDCGANTIILSNGAVLSSTVENVKAGDKQEDLGIKSEDLEKESFDLTVKDAKYQCKGETIDDYTLICANPQ